MKSCFEKQGTEIYSEGTNQSSSFMKQWSNKKIYYLYFVVKNVPKYVKKNNFVEIRQLRLFIACFLKVMQHSAAKSLATPH